MRPTRFRNFGPTPALRHFCRVLRFNPHISASARSVIYSSFDNTIVMVCPFGSGSDMSIYKNMHKK